MNETNLVTTYNFNGQDYLMEMKALNNTLEIVVTNKSSGEEWNCEYDSTYIESLTHKTGNFKKFNVFLCMLKAGLLKTSDCITLDLLSYEDLEQLRTQRLRSHSKTRNSHSNRRYLIIKYNVEFDRIHYPLPLDYSGPPDPSVLQSTIQKLQRELAKTKEQLNLNQNKSESKKGLQLQKRINQLITENEKLREEIHILKQSKNKNTPNQIKTLQKAITNLEKSVLSERKSHHELVSKLRNDKFNLVRELNDIKRREKLLQTRLNKLSNQNCTRNCKANTLNRRQTAPTIPVNKSDAFQRRARSLSSPRRQQEQHRCVKKEYSSRSSSTSRISYNSVTGPIPMHVYYSPSIPRSRSASVTSNNSQTDRSYRDRSNSRSRAKVKNKIQREEPALCHLQGKIKALQRMLSNTEIYDT